MLSIMTYESLDNNSNFTFQRDQGYLLAVVGDSMRKLQLETQDSSGINSLIKLGIVVIKWVKKYEYTVCANGD